MKTIRIIRLWIFITGFAVLQSCYYDSEEELYPSESNCDLSNVTYSGTITAILSQNCYSCHSSNFPQGNVVLDNYDDLKVVIDNGRFWGAVNHESGFTPMPQNLPKLPQCELDKIKTWLDNGAMNN
ncbi:MAG: hypothetical protein JW731_00725 [Bacteroidales bacterium]|nr:hypothetical protein [Bacteroidales bacterium]